MMKKFLSIAVGLVLGANTAITLNLQKGWQLKGFPFDVNVSKVFNKDGVIAVCQRPNHYSARFGRCRVSP
jgi:hypothetical protein